MYIPNFTNIHLVGAELFLAGGQRQTDGRTERHFSERA
jgi:hypothetical protein